jgi:integrase
MASSNPTAAAIHHDPETSAPVSKKPRRKHRCMFRDERGRWWLDYYAPDGRRRRKLAGKTKADADRLLRQIRGSIDRGEYVDAGSSPGFSDFAATFMERHGNHKASYRDGASWINRLKEHFGNRKLSAITAGHIEEYRLARKAEPDARDNKSSLSLSTIDREVSVLRAMLGKAVKWGMLAKNPADRVEDYREDNTRERFLASDEIHRLLLATKQTSSAVLRPALYLALETGLRKSELLSLRWSDIDFESGQILIRETKSGEPRRVPMSRRARWVLSKLAAKNPLAEWVFESRDSKGERAPARDTKTAWARVLRLARIEDFRFHDLRHTFASHFAMKGGNIYALAKILGHSNPKMTLDRYAHLSPEFVNEQRRVMDLPTYAAAKG